MVYSERAEMAAVSCGTSHVTVKQRCNYTTSVDIKKENKKTRHEKLVTDVKLHASSVSLLESGYQRYIKVINDNNNVKQHSTCSVSELSCVKVEVAVLGHTVHNSPYGLCGRKATLNLLSSGAV